MNILDLPTEMLLTIFKKMNIVDVLYSLVDLSEELNQLIFDPLNVHTLDLTSKSSFDTISPIETQVLDRISSKILPRIHDKVKNLVIEPVSMECILHTVEYPQLYSLSLGNFQQDVLLQQLTEDTFLRRLLTNQITSLDVQIRTERKPDMSREYGSKTLGLLMSMCKHLNELTFRQWFTECSPRRSISALPSASCVFSTLTKLNIYVNTFDDCLYLLDGRFQCLSTLIINVIKVFAASSDIDNTKKLPKLKCFTLKSYSNTFFYDIEIVPLLCRMPNLEELALLLSVIRIRSTYIDGTHLYDEILIHMPRLNKFTFSISTTVYNIYGINLPSNDDIQRGFIEKGNQQIDSYTNDDSHEVSNRCHVYSIPYPFDTFLYLTSAFSGGRFDNVQWLVMRHNHPFEPEVFKTISQSFPSLRRVSIFNLVAQKNKQHLFSLNTFAHLVELHLSSAHIDYADQLLSETKTYLARLRSLEIEYETLAILTTNFTNDATHLNCAQLQHLVIKEPFVPPETFHLYFPSL